MQVEAKGRVFYSLDAPPGSPSTSIGTPVTSKEVYQSVLRRSFSVHRSTGVLTLTKALSRDLPFGFSRWQMNVLAVDQSASAGAMTGYCVVSVELRDINDHAPVFDTCCLRGSVREDSSSGNFDILNTLLSCQSTCDLFF